MVQEGVIVMIKSITKTSAGDIYINTGDGDVLLTDEIANALPLTQDEIEAGVTRIILTDADRAAIADISTEN